MDYTRIELTCEEGGKSTRGYAMRRDLPTPERVFRTLRILVLLWGIAIVTVFIPILHFVLVPLFFVLGVVFAVLTFLERGMVLEGEVTCPNCQTLTKLLKDSESWPKSQRCDSCYMSMQIKPVKIST